MKKLPFPLVDDVLALQELSQNRRVASYPTLSSVEGNVLEQYRIYDVSGGDPWLIDPLTLPDGLPDNLRKHYSLPPEGLSFLAKIRDEGSPDVCPMCGSLKTGTLDHYLPKTYYPEFAIYSKNLIPACDCNTLRKDSYRGDSPTERPLHPYYHSCLENRLYRAGISGDFLYPTITITTCCGPIADLLSVQFHLEIIIKKTRVVKWLESKWAKLIERPDVMIRNLPDGQITVDQLIDALEFTLFNYDEEHDTPNNWHSFFYAGILAWNDSLDLLTSRINALR